MRGAGSMRPLISIIVPIYKVERYLERCIESIVKQTYHNLEIILVDDGSPDSCPSICDIWKGRDKRIKVIHKVNGGLSEARNVGIEVATGEWIAFIDSDDYIEATYIEDMYDAGIRTNVDIIECGVLFVNEEGKILRDRSIKTEVTLSKIEALKQLIIEKGVYQTVWNKLYKSRIIKNIKFEVGRQHEDDFWTYQIIDQVDRITILPKNLYYYLQREKSIMGNGYTLKRLDGLEARNDRMKFLKKYSELDILLQQKMILDCMWHYQCVCRTLKGDEYKKAVSVIYDIIKNIPVKILIKFDLTKRYNYWCIFFRVMPKSVARIRNFLKIGL